MERGKVGHGVDVFYLNRGEARFLYDEIFTDQAYVKHGISLDADSIVFDVGANIGLVGVYLQERWPGIRLFCFEPIPDTFAVLEANVNLHGVNARLFRCALGPEHGEVTLTFYPHNSVMSGRYADRAEDSQTTRSFMGMKKPGFLEQGQSDAAFQQRVDAMLNRMFESRVIACPMRRLSEVISSEGIDRIDLLKIDVEKAEHEVIAGIDDGDWAKIRQIVLELHDVDGRLASLTDVLSRRGFILTVEQDPRLASAQIYNVFGRRDRSDHSSVEITT